MLTGDDILDREVARLQHLIENRKFSFLRRLSNSKAGLFVIAIMVLLFQMRNLPETLANSSLDAAIAVERPVKAPSVRLVTIDNEDYATMFHSRSPLDPAVLAKILVAVAKGHPRAIVVDIDTSDASFSSLGAPQIPTVWNASGEQLADGKFSVDAPLGGQAMPAGSVVALAAVPQDDRGIVRGYRHTYPLETGGSIESPGYAAARMAEGHVPEELKNHGEEMHFLDYRYRFVPIRARDLVQDADSSTWEKLGLFAGQVVVVGGTYRVARDQFTTPKGLMNGCEIVAQAAAAEIDGTFISSASRWTTGLLLVMGGLATLAVYHWLKFRMAFLVSLAMVPLLSVASNWILFHRFAAWGAMIPLVIAVIVAELYSKAALYLAFYEKVAKLRPVEPDAEDVPSPS
ncbi:MAG: CHASE2 domain-containing protein [Terracidiphilus sp.]|jgi:CHASE2 domain-containing sensor protein